MRECACIGLQGDEPLAVLAAIGLLRIAARAQSAARLSWVEEGGYCAVLHLAAGADPIDLVESDLERWRRGHPALDFARGADRKTQDLKAPPAELRALMRSVQVDREAADFFASYVTGVATDTTGQTKPTSFHLCAGQQRFMDAVLGLCDGVQRQDIQEALFGPWQGRVGPKDLRWRSASERNRALLAFDPSKEKSATIAGADWLAIQALPLFPSVPVGRRIVTTGFRGRGKHERFVWPLWLDPLSEREVRSLLAIRDLEARNSSWRQARGISAVFESTVVRSSQGYGNLSPSRPL